MAEALTQFDSVWDSLWPTERSRIVSLLVEGIDYEGRDGTPAVRLRPGGIGKLC